MSNCRDQEPDFSQLRTYHDDRDDMDYQEGDAYCPCCGAPLTYWEGIIDQDRQGNDIDGYNWMCGECGYESKIQEV